MPAFAVVAGEALFSIISSVDAVQAPLLIVHLNVTLLPPAKPVRPVVALALEVITALPLCTLHAPVPVVGILAVTVPVLTLHTLWSLPADAAVGGAAIATLTSSVVAVHPPLLIVHRNATLPPTVIPVTVVVALVGVVIVHVPLCTLHNPVPVTAVLPDSWVVVTLHRLWSVLAFAAVGGNAIFSSTSSVDALHAPLLIVQRNVTLVPAVKPVTVVVGLVAAVIVQLPATILHPPVPVVAVLPKS